MAEWMQLLITSVVSLVASSGFWAFFGRRSAMKSATTRLLLVLAYDKMTSLGMHYIEQGWISRNELEDFLRDLYEPYIACGGNGVGRRIKEEVSALPLRAHDQYAEIGVRADLPSSRDNGHA